MTDPVDREAAARAAYRAAGLPAPSRFIWCTSLNEAIDQLGHHISFGHTPLVRQVRRDVLQQALSLARAPLWQQASRPGPGSETPGEPSCSSWRSGKQETWVDFRNADRAPLLFTAAGSDHTMPPSVNKSNAHHYKGEGTITDYIEFPRPIALDLRRARLGTDCRHGTRLGAAARPVTPG
ncbi:hypothetical protein M2302_005878 [Micromonospora sp. A200]|uniref:hypothetical protein n=1 Tax=Micromonospora sp. A200 TaxID=2940568 RepID=UPI0024750EC0|nr:hypothetical protein [Micromonospora sp. A200]MDH6465676.1 hypothetical protein [Micromonospora sp. A200]